MSNIDDLGSLIGAGMVGAAHGMIGGIGKAILTQNPSEIAENICLGAAIAIFGVSSYLVSDRLWADKTICLGLTPKTLALGLMPLAGPVALKTLGMGGNSIQYDSCMRYVINSYARAFPTMASFVLYESLIRRSRDQR